MEAETMKRHISFSYMINFWRHFARNDAAMDVDLERGFGMDDGAPMLGLGKMMMWERMVNFRIARYSTRTLGREN